MFGPLSLGLEESEGMDRMDHKWNNELKEERKEKKME